jgi:formamidopyrimidine-DNA glycosylase
MPELPEVETVVRQLQNSLVGRRILGVEVRNDDLRRPVPAEKLAAAVAGETVSAVHRRGKYILVHLSGPYAVLIHLGMTGSLRLRPSQDPLAKHEHVVFSMDRQQDLRFDDPRRFGLLEPFLATGPDRLPNELAGMGPEPFSDGFDAPYLHARARRCRQSVKVFLLDQSVVAGIGNIYASELLFRAGVRPGKAAARLTRPEWERVVAQTRAVLRDAIAAGGTTISDYEDLDGSAGGFDRQLRVYGRSGEPCLACGTTLRQQTHGGRSTFYCPRCQR